MISYKDLNMEIGLKSANKEAVLEDFTFRMKDELMLLDMVF